MLGMPSLTPIHNYHGSVWIFAHKGAKITPFHHESLLRDLKTSIYWASMRVARGMSSWCHLLCQIEIEACCACWSTNMFGWSSDKKHFPASRIKVFFPAVLTLE